MVKTNDPIGFKSLGAHDLHTAMQRNDLYLMYQAKYILKTRQICGFEALLRWKHPQLDNISPLQFIPLAEQTNMIDSLTFWVLKKTCRFARKMMATGIPVPVTVNISGRSISDPSFAERILCILADEGVPPQWIGLELTETAGIDSLCQAKEQLTVLHNAGLSLHLDDFGTGYSNLRYLYEFPFDVLKIDKCFIDDLHVNIKKQKLLLGVLQLAEILDIPCVMEGIELESDLSVLVSMPCTMGQGFLFSRPQLESGALALLPVPHFNPISVA